jgi:DNA-binding transcriptional MocR family regulator
LASAIAEGATAFFMQPRAQNPTGTSTTPARFAELAALLDGSDVLVVEDDSAGMIATSPAASLGARLPQQVLHIRSYSKSHGPDLRLAVVSGAAEHVEALIERRHLGQGWTSRLLQLILTDLLTRSSARAHVDRARLTYAERRSAVVSALAEQGVEVAGTDGLNIWLPVRDESAALVRLASVGIGAAAGSPFLITPGAAHLRITTALARRDHASIARHLADAARVGAISGRR